MVQTPFDYGVIPNNLSGQNGSVMNSAKVSATSSLNQQSRLLTVVSGGKSRHKQRGGSVQLIPLYPASYNSSGLNDINYKLQQINMQANANAVGDKLLQNGGKEMLYKSRRRTNRKRRRTNRKRRRTNRKR